MLIRDYAKFENNLPGNIFIKSTHVLCVHQYTEFQKMLTFFIS